MTRTASTSTDDHSADWLANVAGDGALQLLCEHTGGAILVTAGWGNVKLCPACGDELDVEVME